MQERLDGRAKLPPRTSLFPRPRDLPPSGLSDEPSARAEPDSFEDLDLAVNALRRIRPDLSAGEPVWPWQKRTLLLLPAVFVGAMLLAPEHAVFVLATILVVPFFCVVALRTVALWNTAAGHKALPGTATVEPAMALLPRYSVLVPIYDEAAVVPDLIAALSAIDYPHDRLQILIIVESIDAETRAAVAGTPLPPSMSVVIVPNGSPRTKPRALNYGLRRATGDLIVIYDAEDVPEPDQLRRAARVLATSPGLGCVQARLNVLNDTETWLTRGVMAQTPEAGCEGVGGGGRHPRFRRSDHLASGSTQRRVHSTCRDAGRQTHQLCG